MDHKWIYAPQTSLEYENGVNEFLEFASMHDLDNNGKFLCPCVNCLNERRLSADQIQEHVVCDGFNKGYTKWIWHGEFEMPSGPKKEEVDADMYDRVEEMINDIGAEAFEQVYTRGVCETLSTNVEKPLYKDCENFSCLSAVLKLITLKAAKGWSDKSFTELLGLLKSMLLEDNELPNSNYEAKKILCPLGLGCKKIHACPNDCILYRNEYKSLYECPMCGVSRYKKEVHTTSNARKLTNRPQEKLLWYISIIPRSKRLFSSAKEAKNLRWHVDERIDDGMLRQPGDSP